MRITVVLLALYLSHVEVYCILNFWRSFNLRSIDDLDDESFTGYKDITVIGSIFVKMLGFPQKCEKKGISHACSLSFACWMVGGSSQSGCGANPWLVACCVTSRKPRPHIDSQVLHESKELTSANTRRNDRDECGLSADKILTKRIIGGDEARFAQFPWQALLKISAYQCGGVLVSRRFVATAAHCIIHARLMDITVYLGELDTQDTGKVLELAPAELHRVKRKIIHPKFQFKTTQPDRYDLALLEMVTAAGHSFHIVPICLPSSTLILQGRQAVVAGWGKVKPSNTLRGTNVLHSASVPILSTEKCISWHKTKNIKVELYSDMLCAGHEDGKHDACLGDSGGPLIVLESGRWTLAGITSAGFGCGEHHQPGIYHSVPTTSGWIRSIINLG